MTVGQKLQRALRAFLASSLADLFWYGLMACSVWLFFYVAFRTAFRHRRVSRQEPTRQQVGREILHSLRSLAVFGLVGGVIACSALSGWTRIYRRIDDHGWAWF